MFDNMNYLINAKFKLAQCALTQVQREDTHTNAYTYGNTLIKKHMITHPYTHTHTHTSSTAVLLGAHTNILIFFVAALALKLVELEVAANGFRREAPAMTCPHDKS